jgi:single-strand DNA-binding protein
MINRVILVGRMTKDPVLRKTQSGASITSFTVACDRRVKAEGQPTADFINCVCWNKAADNTAKYTHKGSLVGVEGRIQTRSFDDQSGKRVYITEVVADSVQFLEPKGTNRDVTSNTPSYDAGNQGYQSNVNDDEYQIQEDDLPF